MIKTFEYTDAKGKVSQRDVWVSVDASKLVGGYDVSSLSEDDQKLFAAEAGKLDDMYKTMLLRLAGSYELDKSYRSFNPSNMTNIKHKTF